MAFNWFRGPNNLSKVGQTAMETDFLRRQEEARVARLAGRSAAEIQIAEVKRTIGDSHHRSGSSGLFKRKEWSIGLTVAVLLTLAWLLTS
jgi:hypothetical protein